MKMFRIAAGLVFLAGNVASKTCHNATIEIPVSSRNGVFDDISTPRSNFDAATFSLNATRQGVNGTQEALSGYSTVSGKYKISTQYCMPNASSDAGGRGFALQILTHGIGFDKTWVDAPIGIKTKNY